MPELPEVEVGRRQLQRWASGRVLREVRVLDRAVVRRVLSSKPSDALPDGEVRLGALVGREAGPLQRYGKRLGWTFGDRAILCHFGMSGAWLHGPPSDPPPPVARLGLVFDDVVVWFVDGRRFGCVVPIAASELATAIRADCGPDALLEPRDGPGLRAALTCKKPIKVAMMEQDRLAGIGNIHAAEACFRAKLWPKKRADTLSASEWAALADAIVAQLSGSIDVEGEQDELVYVNLGGPNPFSVYGREGEPCPVCGTTIVAEELGGRTTYWCPHCQPAA